MHNSRVKKTKSTKKDKDPLTQPDLSPVLSISETRLASTQCLAQLSILSMCAVANFSVISI